MIAFIDLPVTLMKISPNFLYLEPKSFSLSVNMKQNSTDYIIPIKVFLLTWLITFWIKTYTIT